MQRRSPTPHQALWVHSEAKEPSAVYYIGALAVLMAMVFLGSGCASAPVVPYMPLPEPKAATAPRSDGAIWDNQSLALFEDQKARRVGDVLTVLLIEQTQASKKASTSSSRDSSTDIANPTLFGLPLTHNGTGIGGFGLDSSSNFSGAGDSSQSNKLEGSLSVLVVKVLPNGNLMVRGEKNLELNQGAEVMALEGIVRPQDVSPANTVTSDRIAAARIHYSGEGALADSNRAGWLTRFFQSGWMPF